MPITNICKSVECPYYGESGNNYGCQRYAFSCGCHLRVISKFASTEYILYIQQSEPVNISGLKQENNRFLMEDPKYKDDLAFQAKHPDFFDDGRFKVKHIA